MSQRIGKPFYRVLGRRIHALQRTVQSDSSLPRLISAPPPARRCLSASSAAMHHAPEIGLEQAVPVSLRPLFVAPENRPPALLTQVSMRPKRPMAAWPSCSTSARTPTSVGTVSTCAPPASARWPVAPGHRRHAQPVPSAKPFGIRHARGGQPMPLVAPVITITCSGIFFNDTFIACSHSELAMIVARQESSGVGRGRRGESDCWRIIKIFPARIRPPHWSGPTSEPAHQWNKAFLALARVIMSKCLSPPSSRRCLVLAALSHAHTTTPVQPTGTTGATPSILPGRARLRPTPIPLPLPTRL